MPRKTFANGFPLPASDLNTYLMDQAVQTYADATARTAALATPVEGQVSYLADQNTAYVYDGSSWNAVVDAKNAPNVISTRRNYIINGGFDVFQRGTFASQTASNYCLDRWYAAVGGTVTITQQTAGVPIGSQYCMRVAYNASSSFANTRHALSSDLVAPLRGQTVTLSAKVRRNSSFAANLSMNLYKNATADTQSGGTWTSISSTSIANASMPTGTTSADWYTVTATVAIPNDGTANGLRVEFGESAASASGQYYEVAAVQLELGSVATPFSRAGGTLQGELAACQRYYYRITAETNYGAVSEFGLANNTSYVTIMKRNPVTMRTSATSIDYGNLQITNLASVTQSLTGSLTIEGHKNPDYVALAYSHGSAIFTAGASYYLRGNNNSSGYLGISAEL